MKICETCHGKAVIDCARCKSIGADHDDERSHCLTCRLMNQTEKNPCPTCKGSGTISSDEDSANLETILRDCLNGESCKTGGARALAACTANGMIFAQAGCGLEPEFASALITCFHRNESGLHLAIDLGKLGAFSVASDESGTLFLITKLNSVNVPMRDTSKAEREVLEKLATVAGVKNSQGAA